MIQAGRFPAGFCIWPPVPVVAPLLRCPLHTCRDSPGSSKPVPRHHVREEAAGSAFFRYSRVKTAQTRDFPRQFSLNFKPRVLSLSRATLGSQGREQRSGLCPTADSPAAPGIPRAPLSLPTPHCTIMWGRVGQSPSGAGNPRAALCHLTFPGLAAFAAQQGSGAARGWADAQLVWVSMLQRQRHDHAPGQSSGFHLAAGMCLLGRTACPPPSSFSSRVQPPPGLSFLHSFPPFLITSPQLPEMAART